MMTPTMRERPAPGERRGGNERRLARDWNAGGLDHEKDGDEYVAVLTDPLIYNVEHPLFTVPGWGFGGQGRRERGDVAWEGRKLDGWSSGHKRQASTGATARERYIPVGHLVSPMR